MVGETVQALVLDEWEEFVGILTGVEKAGGELELTFRDGSVLLLLVEEGVLPDEAGPGDRLSVLRTDDSLEETFRVRLDA